MAWLPISADKLSIGLHIKINDGWMSHPFVRQSFTISSPSEIAIILRNGLTKLFYDPERSHADALARLTSPQEDSSPDVLEADLHLDESALRREKEAHIQQIVDHRASLTKAEAHYATSVERCEAVLRGATEGHEASLALAKDLLAGMNELATQQSTALSLVRHGGKGNAGLAAEAMNVAALAHLTSRTLQLSATDSEHLSLGALFHNVGKQRLPAHLLDKPWEDLSPADQRLLRWHPQLGREVLAKLGGVDPDVITIVAQHHERLDGSGAPRGLSNGAISPLARIVGTIAEYHELTDHRRKGLTPTQTLAFLYQGREKSWGPTAVEAFIGTVTVYPPGSFVELSDGHIACVVKVHAKERLRPVVMIYEPDQSFDTVPVVDLARDRALTITRALDPGALPPQALRTLDFSTSPGYTFAG